ncbi:sensor histidine kinase [Saccharothrix syringae]|uniref:histidine kinase n=1 Tax=Saccharothrix syringae TaxID=103733 RepID=A0A5Q0H2H4_SACSY|nr:HAMP domain-containing sensor histidine kinase [Saccharothrix syringae]QFZ20115.1 HAMP domain-containing histidine kinase [Saccharothrix syringae]
MNRRAHRSRSLRKQITLIATLIVAVPVIAATMLAAMISRNSAMQPHASPVKVDDMCVSGHFQDSNGAVMRIFPTGRILLLEWENTCKSATGENDGIIMQIKSKEMMEYFEAGDSLTDKSIVCEASHTSYAMVPDLSLWPLIDPNDITYSVVSDTGERRGRSLPLAQEMLGPGVEKLAQVQRALNGRTLSLYSGALLLIGLFALVVWVAMGRVLRPVEAIRREMADITEHDLTRRVPVSRGRNEVAALATTVNATLDRLEAVVEDNRRFVADASHELRSPIAALRAELEIATAHPGLTDWPAVVDAALTDTHRLQQLATDLLLLARLDHTSTTTPGSDIVDLTTLVRDQTAHRRSRHALTVDLPGRPTPVHGSHSLLDRLLGNLLDNAERHATTAITVRLTTDNNHATLEVLDDGPGIPLEDRERVFDRFTRLDDARTRDTGGTGLGLPIARRIATNHHGTLHATDHPNGGARLVITLPLSP